MSSIGVQKAENESEESLPSTSKSSDEAAQPTTNGEVPRISRNAGAFLLFLFHNLDFDVAF